MLRARLIAAAEEEAASSASAARRSQVRTVDRSERIRTYNYPENRISDHRIGFKAYNLDQVLNGELQPVITALQEADTAARLAAVGETSRCTPADMSGTHSVRAVLADASARLRSAGVGSPEADARTLLAYACGIEPARIPLLDGLDDEAVEAFEALVASRAARVPLQHLTGRAYFRHVELEVGPGVFVPRPETEVMTGWAIDALRPAVAAGGRPRVVELCSGSGAIAKALVAGGDLPRRVRRGGLARGRRVRPPEPGRHAGRAVRRGHGRRPARARRPGRPRDRQPALHPARRVRLGGAGGPRPRPAAGAVLGRGRPRRDPGRHARSRPGCCGPAACCASSTPTCRGSPPRPW